MPFNGWPREPLRLIDGSTVEAVCPVVVSASRATDIPAFYARWFAERLAVGYVRRVNPFNPSQIRYVSFSHARVVVFWSKNPRPIVEFLPRLEARGLHYYFQFTLNDYEREGFEPNVPPLDERIDTFRLLAERVGPKRVVWRFDPLILTDTLTVGVLAARVAALAERLRGCTERLVVSFADVERYRKVRRNFERQGVRHREFTPPLMEELAGRLQDLNRERGLAIATCAEAIDLTRFGIAHNRCIDDRLMIDAFPDDTALMRFLGAEAGPLADGSRPSLKDRGQRKACGCIVSQDIGTYDTCRHFCTYCYANASREAVARHLEGHRIGSDSLVG